MPDSVLAVSDLGVTLDGKEVLRDVSFALGRGEILAVIGHNGAGKSTLLRTIMGLNRPSAGTIFLEQKDVARLSTTQRHSAGIAMTLQAGGVFPTLSVSENLSMPSTGRDEVTLDEVFETFPALAERRKQAAGSLSGGQRQMLAISMALRSRPGVLMLDEPSVGLQPTLVEAVLSQIGEIRNRHNTSIVLVEQNLASALECADRVLVLNQGRVLRDAATTAVTEEELWEML